MNSNKGPKIANFVKVESRALAENITALLFTPKYRIQDETINNGVQESIEIRDACW